VEVNMDRIAQEIRNAMAEMKREATNKLNMYYSLNNRQEWKYDLIFEWVFDSIRGVFLKKYLIDLERIVDKKLGLIPVPFNTRLGVSASNYTIDTPETGSGVAIHMDAMIDFEGYKNQDPDYDLDSMFRSLGFKDA
jgi:hypothetical protein